MFRRPTVRYGATPEPETPYQRAGQVWDERIGSARVQAKNWRLAFFATLALSGGLAAGLVWQSARGTVTPWVVQVDRLGQAQAVAPAVADYRPTDPQIAWHLARFIEEVRSIPDDPVVLRQNWLDAYNYVTDKGALALNDYARTNDPFSKIGKAQVAVDVVERDPRLRRQLPRRMGRTSLRRRRVGGHRTLERHSNHRRADADRCRSAQEEPTRRLRPCPQLVQGARLMRTLPLATLLLASASLGACSTWKPPAITYDDTPRQAVLQPDPPKSVQVVEVPKLLPLPGQLKPIPGARTAVHDAADPHVRVDQANGEARVQPTRAGYINAIQVYPYSDGALYQVYAAPGEITDIALEPGEQLVGSGPVAAGDTVRWIIGDTVSGAGPAKRVHILLKPTRPDLVTNLIIDTDRRTYHLELRSDDKTYMAAVSWLYAEDQLIALRQQNAAADAATPIVTGIDINALNFRYRIEGDNPAWRPLRAFDDGRHVFIEFPAGIGQGEMPPLWVIGAAGGAELVNYRVQGNHMIVDRMFAAAELRLGGDPQQKVRIVRTDGRPRS